MILDQFHDENIVAIELTDKSFSLTVTSNETICNICITDLKELRMDGLRKGNIINSR